MMQITSEDVRRTCSFCGRVVSASVLALIVSFSGLLFVALVGTADDNVLHKFDRVAPTDVYYSEGANAGDLNNDGIPDAVYGPYWFAGPDFKTKHEIYAPKEQDRNGYANNFFNWTYDFNGDGWKDVLVVGFPGTPAYVYENPKADGFGKHWAKHKVLDFVANESPQFVNLVGDDRPELVFTSGGFFGFASPDWSKPFEAWTFHPISEKSAPENFGHGLGVGDVNGDGRNDIIMVGGWYEQPKEDVETSRWLLHRVEFSTAYGGADMFAYDVDGDGDNDVITSDAAHDFGLLWYEQDKEGDTVTFRRHEIMGDQPEKNRYGLVFSELHSLALVDVDGDGLKDIVTGKTYWSHHKRSPMWDAGAVVYWFRLVRRKNSVDWVPYQADADCGIGRQVSIVDVNNDKLPDIVLGGMKGAHVLLHRREKVSAEDFEKAQPKVIEGNLALHPRGPKSRIDRNLGRVPGAIEAEELTIVSKTAGDTRTQDMTQFTKDRWSGGKQLFWSNAKPGAKITLSLNVPETAKYDISGAFTRAADYAIIAVSIDNTVLAESIDLYNSPDVISSGLLRLGSLKLEKGSHQFSIEVKGANPSAQKKYMVGLDYLLINPSDD